MAHPPEIADLRLDLNVLGRLIDALLDDGHTGDDPLLQACAAVLRDRRRQLERLEHGVSVTRTA